MFLFSNKELKSRNSVIIFDEVQKFPKAREAIKYLVKDGRFHYIETGSLISIKNKSNDIFIPSEEDKRKMYPMDFEEFLWAIGDNLTGGYIKDCFEKRIPVGDKLHRKIMETFFKNILDFFRHSYLPALNFHLLPLKPEMQKLSDKLHFPLALEEVN